MTEEQKQILSDKMDTLRCLSCSKYFPDPCEDCSFVEVFNDVVDFVSSLLQKEREAGKREGIEEVIGYTENRLYDCSGCTDPDSEGTHSEMTKQHYKEMLKSQSVEKGKSDLDDDFEFVGGEK